MASTINAQTTPFAAIVQTADGTGNLALQTVNVTAVTIDTSQNATFANVVTATTFVGSANASSLTTGTVPTARLATGTANSSTFLRGDQTWTEVTQTRISGGTTGLTPSTLTSGDVTLAGTLAVANGGTGATTLDSAAVIIGNGTSAPTFVAPGTSGNVLTSNGSAWSSSVAPTPAALSTASGSAPSYSARAWVNFNGQGTIAIRASENVSSLGDNGTGDYTVNFSTAMVDANYAVSGTAQETTGVGSPNRDMTVDVTSSSNVRVFCTNYTGGLQDPQGMFVVVHR